MLEVDRLTSGYSGTAVVRELSLTVGPGEIVALFGANGAGKSTTLRTIFGTIRPLSGDVRLNGQSIVGRTPHAIAQLGVGYVPEGRELAPSLTMGENLRLVDPWKIDPFELFPEFIPLRQRRVGLLSGGEQQMLTVARALLAAPKLLLIDELSFGLAPLVVDRLLERIRHLVDETRLGVLLVEQHVAHALRFADRCYVVARGRLVLEETAATLRARPELLAASYLGDHVRQ